MKKLSLLSTFILLATTAIAQRIGEWQVYPAYTIATQNVAVGSRVYAVMSQNLICYDTEDQSVRTYDSMHDLNDVHINAMAYNEEAKKLVLVYENDNIDLLDLDDEVENLDALKNSSLRDKSVNAVVNVGPIAYVCTGFGFLTLDVVRGVILDTYELGYNVVGVLEEDGQVYVTDGKTVRTAPLDANWHIASTWSTTTAVPVSKVKAVQSEYNLAGGLYWHSDQLKGLRGYKQEEDGTYTLATGSIQPNSPVRDLCYRMHYVGNRLLVAGGVNTVYANYNPATAMYFEDGVWTNFDEEELPKKYSDMFPESNLPDNQRNVTFRHYNTSDIVQDPKDPTHHYASPYRTGLYEYRNGKFVGMYSMENSPLEQILTNGPNYVSATCLQYDNYGNLWMCNQQTETVIRILNPKGTWHGLYYPEIANASICDGYLFTTSGVNFLVSRRMDQRGFFAFHTNKTLNSTQDDKHKLLQVIINEDGTDYAPDQFYCMAEDKNGMVWCGTQLGLFVIEDPTKVFDKDFRFLQVKIPRNDGSGLADYLLSGLTITCIAVDEANRKWIGTSSNGLYLVSADGQELIENFRPENSPILSDNIQCLAINPNTGLLMIGTDKGLCSYMPDAGMAEEELDADNVLVYPNPVRPDYTGPITIDGLMADSEVKICSSTGQLVWYGRSNGGRVVWNGCNQNGDRVSSGVYQIIANSPDGKKAIVSKLAVIK